ncbi:hypothetical protein ACZ91_60820 [Streptomyces regensis]|nr:hypothetical protein ACZ91_60820 [Streptomyces regensis]KOG73597.1 hypothetical protein ADK77_08750 [Streptomyces antibioticus]
MWAAPTGLDSGERTLAQIDGEDGHRGDGQQFRLQFCRVRSQKSAEPRYADQEIGAWSWRRCSSL